MTNNILFPHAPLVRLTQRYKEEMFQILGILNDIVPPFEFLFIKGIEIKSWEESDIGEDGRIAFMDDVPGGFVIFV